MDLQVRNGRCQAAQILIVLFYISPCIGYDRTRNVEIGNKNIKLHHLEEAYTSEHWLVRIYRLVEPVSVGVYSHTHAHAV